MVGMISTGIGVLFISLGAILDFNSCAPAHNLPPLKISNVLTALGTILFTYGGHSAFPTIQHDMRKPSEFNKTAILSFTSKFL